MRRISTSPRYVIDITGTDVLSLGELGGGGGELGKIGKNEVILTYKRMTRS